jgi:hypothetical protein
MTPDKIKAAEEAISAHYSARKVDSEIHATGVRFLVTDKDEHLVGREVIIERGVFDAFSNAPKLKAHLTEELRRTRPIVTISSHSRPHG